MYVDTLSWANFAQMDTGVLQCKGFDPGLCAPQWDNTYPRSMGRNPTAIPLGPYSQIVINYLPELDPRT